MPTIEIHNEKGGVGCTTIANHMIYGAQQIGLRVAAMSLDPTKGLVRELEGTGTRIIEPGDDPGDDTDVLIIDRNTQCRDPVDADVRVVPIRERRSWEIACDLSDRYIGDIIWVTSIIQSPLEIPEYLEGIVQIAPAIPMSHAVAIAAWRRRIVWQDEGLARSAGARAMWCAVYDILRRAMGPRIVVDQPSKALPIEPGASVVLRHGPRPGFRVGAVRPELDFGGEGDAAAELQLLELCGGALGPLGDPWRYEVAAPPAPRDVFGRPHAIGIGEGLLLKITNTGSRPITAAQLIIDDDLALAVPLYVPRILPSAAASAA
jgi:hypothetical protein